MTVDGQNAYDWVHFILRWFHVTGAITWVGSMLYFQWVGRTTGGSEPDAVRATGAGPKIAHWFRRETALTWVSGVLLLFLVYFSARIAELGHGLANLALLAVGWLVYDRLWRGRTALALALSVVLLAGVAAGLGHFYGGRLVYLMLGALLGTLMAGNVWLRVVPALADPADEARLALARQRSTHNSYLTFPVVALMLSSHVPAVQESRLGPLVVVLLVAAFVAARHVVVNGRSGRWALWVVLGLLAAMVFLTGR